MTLHTIIYMVELQLHVLKSERVIINILAVGKTSIFHNLSIVMHNVCAVVKLTSLAILLPVGSPPPLGLRFCQNIEWLMCPPPLNLIAFCTAMTPLTSSAHTGMYR